MENQTKSRWPGYPKEHTCGCGAVYIANSPRSKRCRACTKKDYNERAKAFYYKNRRNKVRDIAVELQALLDKTRDQMDMKDHWLKEAYIANLKTLPPLKAFAKAKKKVAKILNRNYRNSNNTMVSFTAQEKKNMKERSRRWNIRPYNPEVQREERALKRFGY